MHQFFVNLFCHNNILNIICLQKSHSSMFSSSFSRSNSNVLNRKKLGACAYVCFASFIIPLNPEVWMELLSSESTIDQADFTNWVSSLPSYLVEHFFICCLTATRAALSHWQGGSLTQPMLVTAFFPVWLQGHGEPSYLVELKGRPHIINTSSSQWNIS